MRESGSPRLSDLYLTAVALRVSRKSGGIARFHPLYFPPDWLRNEGHNLQSNIGNMR